jgi:sugar phosphate permease
MYGFLGMYPTFLREYLRYSPAETGKVMSLYGLGALASLGGGWIGDRFAPRVVLGFGFPAGAIIGYLLFNGPGDFLVQAALSFAFGVVFAGTLYVNVAAYHVRSVCGALSGRAAGVFVSSYYAAASIAGYTIGWLANSWGWRTAGDMQLALLCAIGAAATFLLRPDRMAERRS